VLIASSLHSTMVRKRDADIVVAVQLRMKSGKCADAHLQLPNHTYHIDVRRRDP
jgi:hypothetical protein